MASASKIKAGGVFIELMMGTTKFDKQIDSVQKRIDSFAASVGKIGLGVGALGGAALGVLSAFVNSFAALGDTFDKMSGRTGQAAEQLSALGFVAERSGSSLEQLDIGLKGLYQNMEKAARGSKEAVDAFSAIGVNSSDLAGMTASKQLSTIADGIARLGSEERKAAIAAQLFGKAGYQLLPMLKGGGAEIDKLTKRANKLGIVMSQKDAKAAADLTDAITDMKRALQGVTISIGSALAPMATSLATLTADTIAFVSAFLKANPVLVKTAAIAAAVATAVGSLGVAIAGVGKMVGFALPAIKALIGVGLIKIAAVAGGAAAAMLALSAAIKAVSEASKDPYELPDADEQRVMEMAREVRKRIRDGESFSDIKKEVENKAANINAKIHIGVDTETLKKEVDSGAAYMKRYWGVQGNKENPLARLAASADPYSAPGGGNLEDDKKEAANYRALQSKMGEEGFLSADDVTEEQKKRFEALDDEIWKRRELINVMRQQQVDQELFQKNLRDDPAIAHLDATMLAAKAAEKEAETVAEIYRLWKERANATKDEAESINTRLDVLKETLVVAAKENDAAQKLVKLSQEALDKQRERTKEVGKSFQGLRDQRSSRAEEKAFRNLLEGGGWKQANESILAEMAKLETEWSQGMERSAKLIASASMGNADAFKQLESLYEDMQGVADRYGTLEGRRDEISGAKEQGEDARFNVLRELDPARYAHEIAAATDGLRQEMTDAFRKAVALENQGEFAGEQYSAANKMLERLQSLESNLPSMDKSMGALAGATFSGAAAQRIGGANTLEGIARDSLSVTKRMAEDIRDIKHQTESGGGLGV